MDNGGKVNSGDMTVRDAFSAFEFDELLAEDRAQKTIASYRSTSNSFIRAIGSDIDVALLTYLHVIQWKRYMSEQENSPAHMALQLRELRRVLTYLKLHSFATLDPSEIKIPKFKYNKTAWFTVEEINQFLSVIESPRDRALFGSMFSSGARISEILSLNRNSIVGGQAIIYGKARKEGRDEPDILVFDDNALKLIESYLDTRTDTIEALFISRQSQRICVQQCIRLVHKYIEMAGIEKNGRGATHILRHSFGTDLEIQGLDLHGISLQLRHKKLETTRIYMHGSTVRKKSDYASYHTPVPIN